MSVKIQNPDRLLACPFFFRWTMKVVERERGIIHVDIHLGILIGRKVCERLFRHFVRISWQCDIGKGDGQDTVIAAVWDRTSFLQTRQGISLSYTLIKKQFGMDTIKLANASRIEGGEKTKLL